MNLSPVLKQRFFDANGLPLAGGQLFSYQAGTTTPQVTYSNSSGTTNTNPVILDASGYADVWIDPTLVYKFVLEDALNNVLWTVDQVSFPSPGLTTWSANTTYAQGAIVEDSSGTGMLYVSLSNGNKGNALSSVAFWRVFAGNVRTLTSNATLVVTDDLVRANSTSGNLTITLPAISSTPIGKKLVIKEVGTGGNSTSIVGSGSDTIDGNNTYVNSLPQYGQITVENNGSSWDVTSITGPVIQTSGIADHAITPIKLSTRTTGGATASIGQVAVSASCGTFSTASTSPVNVTNLSVTITTTGRPVAIALASDGSALNRAFISIGSPSPADGTNAQILINRGATIISTDQFGSFASHSTTLGVGVNLPVGVIRFLDPVAAGTYTYTIQASALVGTGGTLLIQNCVLMAWEI